MPRELNPIRSRAFLLLCFWMVGFLRPTSAQALERPNIVWINCEDLDETLGCYGDPMAKTPHLDELAKESIRYLQAFANAPICAPARSCLITGMQPVSLGSQHLRCEVTLPPGVQPFPRTLREAGYFVTNYAKTDYNFSPDGIYDYWKKDLAPWRQRKKDVPFFSFIVLGTTHEGPANLKERYQQAVAQLHKDLFHDADRVQVPPYFPQTPAMKDILARYHDLVSAMDQEVGQVLQALKEDGLWEDTIVWFFSDHGHGLPRHKRWLLDSGLRVPLLVRIPAKWSHLARGLQPGSTTDQLVTFVDFAPTVLDLASVELPGYLLGAPFLGSHITSPRSRVFATRDRADDLFEVSRAVHDGRHIYVRHFLPHLPYIQSGRIMGDQKDAMRELRRARNAGELDVISSQIWAPSKPLEELYDLSADPHEIHNLAGDPAYAGLLEKRRAELKEWMLAQRDTGLLPEAEYQLRARQAGVSIREMTESESLFPKEELFEAADRATRNANPEALVEMLQDPEAGVRYWGAVGCRAQKSPLTSSQRSALSKLLQDPSPSTAIQAAETLCLAGQPDSGLPILVKHAASTAPWVALQSARSLLNLGPLARPVVEDMERIRKTLEGEQGSSRRYRDFNYASFTGWALESALVACGAARQEDFD